MASELPPLQTDATVTLTFSFTYAGTPYATGKYCGYCAVADVQFEFTNLTGFKNMDASKIAQEIHYAGIELQEALDYSYEMPYAGTNQTILGKLRELNAKLAAARCIDRYYTGNAPNASGASQRLRDWVGEQVMAIEKNLIVWAPPGGDAVPRAQLPAYDRSTLISNRPTSHAGDGSEDPLFALGRTRFRRDDTF